MSETNGSTRFERIEATLERHAHILESHAQMIVSNDAAMERYAAESATRTARIETMIERQMLANDAAHERFEEENKRLLTAQVLMNGAMQKMADGMIEVESKLNALIVTVDGIIRRPDATR